MEKKSSSFFAFAIKVIIIISCSMYCSSGNAQSIAGKWKMTAATETVTDEASGKTHDLTAQVGDIPKMIEQIIEFHNDGTYLTSNTLIGDKKSMQSSGTYIISGKQIKMQQTKTNVPVIDSKFSSGPMNNKLPNTMTIVSQTGNILVLDYGAETTDKGRTFIMDIQDTFTKQ